MSIATGLLLMFCALPAASATEAGLAPPVLGYVVDPANGLQPIRGVTGALTLDTPLKLPENIGKLVVAPRQDYVFGFAASDSHLLRLGSGLSVEALGLPLAGTDLVSMSPAGSAAAVYDPQRNRIQVIAELPARPVLVREFDVSVFSGTLTSLSVNDNASALLVGLSGVGRDEVMALGIDGSLRTFPEIQSASGSFFLKGARDVLIADGPANRIYLIKDVTGQTEVRLLADEGTGIAEPVAVAASYDNKQAFVVSARVSGVIAIDLASRNVTSIDCACAPSQLTPLSGNAIFRLTEPSSGPMWLFDGDAATPRIVFVPPYKRPVEDAVR